MSRKPVFSWGVLALGFFGMILTVPGRPFAQDNQIQSAEGFEIRGCVDDIVAKRSVGRHF